MGTLKRIFFTSNVSQLFKKFPQYFSWFNDPLETTGEHRHSSLVTKFISKSDIKWDCFLEWISNIFFIYWWY